MLRVFSKRLFDFCFSLLLLIFLLPLLLIIPSLIFAHNGLPIFFKQIRPGLYGKPFELLKFRTMKDIRNFKGELLKDDERLNSFGRLLRSTSIDELPELWNVLKGDMSLVGPRPLLLEYLPLYSPAQARRHTVRPGITGWAQINGRNAISWEEKFNFDIWYVDNQCLWLDLKILFLTVKKVITQHGINSNGEETMPRFTGNN